MQTLLRHPSRGFTIVEMLIYMGLLAIFLVIVTNLFLSSLETQVSQEATNSVQQDGRFIISRLAYDIGRASSVVQPTTNGNSGNTLQLTIASNPYTYTVSSGNLVLTTGSGSDQLNSTNTTVSNLNFLRLGNPGGREDAVTISFTIDSSVHSGTPADSGNFETTVALRRNQ